MSGSTIGGFAGALIGFWFGGPSGARWGFMIGSAVGGYVDPVEVEGPRLTDAQTQTSQEGAPRPIIYGTACVAGNVVQCGPLVEHKKKQRQGKGGPEVTTYTYTRTVMIRISEAAPLGGTMRMCRVWKDDKLVADWSEANTIPADTAAFESICTFYSGAEDQLPDPSLEALPTEYGGGVGNVPAYRGTCYVVLTDLDCTDRQGAVPQFRFEVCSDATESALPGPTVGAQTASATLGGSTECAYIDYRSVGVAFGSAAANLAIGGTVTTGTYDDALTLTSSATFVNPGDSPGDKRLWMRGYSGSWQISADNNFGYCELLQNGQFVARLQPALASSPSWWYAEGLYYPEYGGLVWFTASNVYIGVRKVGSSGSTWNKIFRWPLADAGGAVVAAAASSPVVTSGFRFYMHMDRGGTVRAIAESEAELVTYDGDLNEVSRVALPVSIASIRAFAVDSGVLILLLNTTLYFYDLDTFALQHTVVLSGSMSTVNNQIICGDDSVFVRSGLNLKRVDYAPSCYTAAPDGWFSLPDTPNVFTDGVNFMPRCGAAGISITPGMVALPSIVTDLCDRVGIGSDQVDVTALAGIEVRGFPVSRQTTPAEAIRALQDVFFFDFPEWGNSGEATTKLRAVQRGGPVRVTITDDDLVENDDDEGARPQPVEFPRKVSLTAADPDAGYEPATQPAAIDTENVQAVGEISVSTAVVMTRDEIAAVVDKLLKTTVEEASGRLSLELPEEFTRYTPADVVSYQGRRLRIEKAERAEGTVRWDLKRDRASAATSVATGSPAPTPTPPVSSIRGPTMAAFLNLPRLRSSDTTPGMYVGVCGLLPGWIGCDLYLSVDDGVTEQLVATIIEPTTMGKLSADVAADGTTVSVSLYDGELDSATVDQLLARMNAAAVTTADVSEILQFQTATQTGDKAYDLTDLSHGVIGTTAAQHYADDSFVLLDSVQFIPLDIGLAGKTLIFRPVSIGTAPANNPTYSVVFQPKFTGPQVVEAYTDDAGNAYTDDAGNPYYYEVPSP